MNENLRKLMESSGLYIAYENREVTEKELAYFAEAIVQDCVNVLHKNNLYTPQVSEVFAEHFGLK